MNPYLPSTRKRTSASVATSLRKYRNHRWQGLLGEWPLLPYRSCGGAL